MNLSNETISSIERDVFHKNVITASADGIIRIFENKSNPDADVDLQLKSEINPNHGFITKAVFLNCNEYIASSFSSGFLTIWKLCGDKYVLKYENQVSTTAINDISSCYNNNTYQVYCACSDGRIRIGSFRENEPIVFSEIIASRLGVASIDSNTKYIVSGGVDYSVIIWENNEELVRFADHKGLVRDVCIAPENVFNIFCFASCGEDCKVFVYWKHGTDFLKQEIILDDKAYSLSWSKSGFTLTVGYGKNKFRCFEPKKEGRFEEVEIIQIE